MKMPPQRGASDWFVPPRSIS